MLAVNPEGTKPAALADYPTPPPLAQCRGLLLASGALAFALLMLTATRYGYHRDELYFLAASRRMAWGYVDQPPLSVAFVWLSRVLFGGSLAGLRFFPAVADAATAVLAGLIAREFGGGRFAQGLAALSVAVGPFLIAGHLAGPTTYDFLAWAVVELLVIRILRTGDERLRPAVGCVVGVALLNKETILLLVGALAIGLAANGQGRVLRSLWLGAGVLVVEMSRSLRREQAGIGATLKFLPIQLLLPGWWVAPVWLAGWWALMRDGSLRAYRSFGLACALLFSRTASSSGTGPTTLLAFTWSCLPPGRPSPKALWPAGAVLLRGRPASPLGLEISPTMAKLARSSATDPATACRDHIAAITATGSGGVPAPRWARPSSSDTTTRPAWLPIFATSRWWPEGTTRQACRNDEEGAPIWLWRSTPATPLALRSVWSDFRHYG
jgi:hypothetical protein